MNTHAIAYVTVLAKIAGAQIVCNSSHNYYEIEDRLTGVRRDLRTDLVDWGMPSELFHTEWRTTFPENRRMPTRRSHPRQHAIDLWLEENGDHDWVAFDDEEFDVTGHQILINFEHGIDEVAFRKALSRWNLEFPFDPT